MPIESNLKIIPTGTIPLEILDLAIRLGLGEQIFEFHPVGFELLKF
ncbi:MULTISPECIES: hypothetical protein [unclassified Microcoleus]